MTKNTSPNKEINGRDKETGQFVVGHTGIGGRPRGSRNKLGEEFISDLRASWVKHGREAIESVVRNRPHDYLKVIASLLPKELSAEIDVSVSLFRQVDDTNEAYRLAMEYLRRRIEADDESRLIEANNGGD